MQAIFIFIFLVIIVLENISVGYTTRSYPPGRLGERNKEIVLKFYQRVFGDKDFSAFDDYFGDSFIQHNPMLEDGKEALRKAAMGWVKDEPKKKVDIRRVGADGDLVWLHVRFPIFGKIKAIIDIFRVNANGKIVEHWDTIQEVPETSKNNNTMF